MPEVQQGWTVLVDRDVCMGSGQCVHYAPLTFAHDPDTKSVFLQPAGDPIDTVRIAVDACPTGALTLLARDGEC